MILRKLTKAILMLAVLGPAAATADTQGYLGIGGGLSHPTADGFDDASGGRVYGGILMFRNYGLELGYIDFGSFDTSGPGNGSVDVTGPYVALSGVTRISPAVELTGKLGALNYDYEGVSGRSTDGTRPLLGVGLNYYLNPDLALGAEVTHLNDVEDEHINSIWLMLHVRPGGGG